MAITNRRVVTGLDDEGRSCVVIDAPLQADESGVATIWRTDVPASNAGNADTAGGSFSMDQMGKGSSFSLTEMQPGYSYPFHATDTVDYLVILRGEIVLELETGEVTLRPGDVLVDRGVVHAWRVIGDEPLLMACAIVPAHPLKGDGDD